jgi:hypothetical protein
MTGFYERERERFESARHRENDLIVRERDERLRFSLRKEKRRERLSGKKDETRENERYRVFLRSFCHLQCVL